MNYLFQIGGLTGGAIDYSGQALGTLDKSRLNELDGLIGPVPAYATTRWYGPLSFLDQQLQNAAGGRGATRHCDGTPLLPTYPQTGRLEGPVVLNGGGGPVDWNNNQVSDPTLLAQDINLDGIPQDPEFSGFKYW